MNAVEILHRRYYEGNPERLAELEDADYEGHSLSMLNRIAAAVGKRVEIMFVPLEDGAAA